MKNPPKSFATKLIHAGEQRIDGAVRLPVFQTAMFEYSGDDPRGARYTRARRPVALVMCVAVSGRAAAGRLEVRLKALSRPRKEKLIQAVTGVSVANPPGNCLTASTSELENPE